jgi:hypothetical protein
MSRCGDAAIAQRQAWQNAGTLVQPLPLLHAIELQLIPLEQL